MKYTGSLIRESLHDESFLNFVDNVKETKVNWEFGDGKKEEMTKIEFELGDDFVLAVVDAVSSNLKPSGFYSIVKSDFQLYVIFPNKFFAYYPKEEDVRKKAFDYAKSLNVSEGEIIF